MRNTLKRLFRIIRVGALLVLSTAVINCGGGFGGTPFHIVSGSENKALEPILKAFGRKNGLTIHVDYKGSVDIMLMLQEGGEEIKKYDAVWPANSLWITLGDKHHKVKHVQSIMTSPVVFAMKKSVAKQLGLTDPNKKVKIADILRLIREGKLKFMMTSATQSNSGASAYIGFLYALLGKTDALTLDDLRNPKLKEEIRELLAGINRSSGSSGWLKELYVEGGYAEKGYAMVNYEAMVIEANKELVRDGKEPLYVIYPADGTVLADSPLGYVDNGSEKKEKAFQDLQAYLLSEDVQSKLSAHGRRTGIAGLTGDVDKSVFNPSWGINVDKILSSIKLPKAEVLYQALSLYQSDFRKPSLTVFCLDYSGSMSENGGEEQMKSAIRMLLDKEKAARYFIQSANDDVIVAVPFHHDVIDITAVQAKDDKAIANLLDTLEKRPADGGTDIYRAAINGLVYIAQVSNVDKYIPAIILMTDGLSSEDGLQLTHLKEAWEKLNLDIPVFSIMFGAASPEQLEGIAEHTKGRVFNGKKNLMEAFRKAKGYN